MVDPPPLIRPTPGPVRDGFRYDRSRPFAAGQRRGVRLATRPGETVAAPCGGRVRFAGRTPQGDAVTVTCGRWTTTMLGVAPTVRRGATVAAGQRVGRASTTTVGLTLRPVGDRWGYVDPRRWGDRPRPVGPLGPAPRSRPGTRRVPASRPISAPAARPIPVPAPRPIGGPAPAHAREPALRPTPGSVPNPSYPRPAAGVVDGGPGDPVRVDPWILGGGLALAALGLPTLRRRRRAARLWTETRTPVPSIGNGLLRHDTDLLRQRRSAPRARVLDDRR